MNSEENSVKVDNLSVVTQLVTEVTKLRIVSNQIVISICHIRVWDLILGLTRVELWPSFTHHFGRY